MVFAKRQNIYCTSKIFKVQIDTLLGTQLDTSEFLFITSWNLKHTFSVFAMARATALCILAAAICLLRSIAFVPAPAQRTVSAEPAVAAGAALLATVPAGADAFVFKGNVDANLSWVYVKLCRMSHRCQEAQLDTDEWHVKINRKTRTQQKVKMLVKSDLTTGLPYLVDSFHRYDG